MFTVAPPAVSGAPVACIRRVLQLGEILLKLTTDLGQHMVNGFL